MDNSAALAEMTRYTERQLKKAQERQAREMDYVKGLTDRMVGMVSRGSAAEGEARNLATAAQTLARIAAEVAVFKGQVEQLKEIAAEMAGGQ